MDTHDTHGRSVGQGSSGYGLRKEAGFHFSVMSCSLVDMAGAHQVQHGNSR